MAGPMRGADNATMWAVVIALRQHYASMGPARHSPEENREKVSAKLFFKAEQAQVQQGKRQEQAGEVNRPSHALASFRCGRRSSR